MKERLAYAILTEGWKWRNTWEDFHRMWLMMCIFSPPVNILNPHFPILLVFLSKVILIHDLPQVLRQHLPINSDFFPLTYALYWIVKGQPSDYSDLLLPAFPIWDGWLSHRHDEYYHLVPKTKCQPASEMASHAHTLRYTILKRLTEYRS